MLRATDELPLGDEPYTSTDEATRSAERDEFQNFIFLALHQVIHRVGWIFKTESIVMPAFMDWIGGGPVLRGCLPVLNRLGFAVPPVLFAGRLKATRHKKWAVAVSTLAMAGPFAVLAAVWFAGLWRGKNGQPYGWLPWAFLFLYGTFFAMTGINQLATHTLQGKLIRANRRGRLFAVSIVVGAPLAILAAYWWMPRWLARPDGGFGWIFAMPALMFSIAAVVMCMVRESPDNFHQPQVPLWDNFRDVWRVLVTDRNLRCLAIVAALFGGGLMMFPHYQALGREHLGLKHSNLMIWVCSQNLATAIASLLAGPLADRHGNRLALHVTVLAAATAPLAAFILARLDPEVGRPWFWLVFLPIGTTPITIKLLANYTLEIADREHHPRYVSTVGMCLAVPVIVGAPLVGWIVQQWGFQAAFLVGTVTVGMAGALTFRLIEPRHGATPAA